MKKQHTPKVAGTPVLARKTRRRPAAPAANVEEAPRPAVPQSETSKPATSTEELSPILEAGATVATSPPPSPSGFEEIREFCRAYEHVTRADVRLQLHIWSIKKRLGLVQAVSDTHGHADETEEGHEAVDTLTANALEEEAGGPALDDTHGSTTADLLDQNMVVQSLLAARAPLQDAKELWGKGIARLVQMLPVARWILDDPLAKGFGLLSAGRIIGACETMDTGNVLNAKNPAKVWKRMGLGVTDGQADRRRKADTTAGKLAAVKMGYSPTRRSIMHQVGSLILRAQAPQSGRPAGPLYTLYLERKAYELGKIQPGQMMGTSKKSGKPKDLRVLIANKRAMRYIEKRLLREFWRAWHAATRGALPCYTSPQPDQRRSAPNPSTTTPGGGS